MQVKVYDYLTEDAKFIRETVFMKEQGFENEFDDVDNAASHIVMYDDRNRPVATCRVFESSEKHEFILGRLAVMGDFRGMQIGTKMVQEAENIVLKKGGTSLVLHAQCRVEAFYEQSGYAAFGTVEDDEGCPHIWMRKRL